MIVRNQVICADGYRMSIQASSAHYCTPKKTDAKTYSSVEILVYEFDELLAEYIDDNNYSNNIGGMDMIGSYVPAETIIRLLIKHGGAIQGEIPPFDTQLVDAFIHDDDETFDVDVDEDRPFIAPTEHKQIRSNGRGGYR